MIIAGITFLAQLVACAGDWPNFRGPNHDGISSESIRTNWAAEPPKEIWRTPLNPALCSLTVSGGRVFTQVRRRVALKDREFCLALDAQTGKELWATDIGIAKYPDPVLGFLRAEEDGPRSTPAVAGDR
ncbi:MAG: alcohol dehydrogenase, partial [Pedosphaera parvula]|nr:alcohol dehydrogenase [Pedosphaera parvula]